MISQFWAECLLTLRVLFRQPGFWVPTILFPAMLYTFFGAQSGGTQWAANAMASFCVYAVVGVGFFQFGVSIAQDRESPFEAWQRSLPRSLTAQWSARIVAAVMITALAVALVVAMALVLNAIRLDATAWARLALVCLVSVVPATLLGIALGTVASARAAVPLANLVYLPLAYLGGLWVPPMVMPSAIAAVSEWTPTRAMGELSWAAVSGDPFEWSFVVLLLAWTLAAVLLASFVQLRRRL
ncbi:ABC transporter permease [Salinarimonas sp.]|uniref:ABC transporter permease n=1 Tax=Salinarimonas sp. TaxID=2766526 RepID=UPI0032D9519B